VATCEEPEILALRIQGSYQTRTTVKKIDREIDIDVGLYLGVDADGFGPVTVREWTYEAPDGHTHRVELHRHSVPPEPLDWGSTLKARAQTLRTVVTYADKPLTVVEEVVKYFHRARRPDVRQLIEMLATLGHMDEVRTVRSRPRMVIVTFGVPVTKACTNSPTP